MVEEEPYAVRGQKASTLGRGAENNTSAFSAKIPIRRSVFVVTCHPHRLHHHNLTHLHLRCRRTILTLHSHSGCREQTRPGIVHFVYVRAAWPHWPDALAMVVSYLRMRSAEPSVWEKAKPRVRRILCTARTLRMAFWNWSMRGR